MVITFIKTRANTISENVTFFSYLKSHQPTVELCLNCVIIGAPYISRWGHLWWLLYHIRWHMLFVLCKHRLLVANMTKVSLFNGIGGRVLFIFIVLYFFLHHTKSATGQGYLPMELTFLWLHLNTCFHEFHRENGLASPIEHVDQEEMHAISVPSSLAKISGMALSS